MIKQNLTTIEGHLRKAGIASGDGLKLSRLASCIRESGQYFGPDQASILKAHFSKGYVGTAIMDFLEESLSNGDWVRIVQEARERDRKLAMDPNLRNTGCSLLHVSPDNPYGWTRPGPLKEFYDTDEPGAWNAYRQTYNLEDGTKVQGCTQFSVLGPHGLPKVEFDPTEVAEAILKESLMREGKSS